ncbi:MAG TPA: amidohydrolase family protein [Candidatus Binatia bacterium]|nr:amidohydrolase family protein [Candidatus Binatia bacterium]
MDRHLVVSSDCHAGLPAAQYREYLDPQYREVFDVALPIQISEMERMSKMFLISDINAQWRKGREVDLAGAWDSDVRLRVLEADGIAAEIIFPDGITEMNTPPFGAGLSLPVEDRIVPELQWAGARAHNRWLAEFVAMQPKRRVGVALCPALWDVDEAVREVEWCARNGLRGILLPCLWGRLDAYHHPKFDPLWSACEDNDVVVHFHSGAAPMEDAFGPIASPDGVHRPGAMGIYISEVVWWCARPLTFLIWGGVLERHPRLRVAVTEGTTIWVPEYLTLLDQRYEETHYSAKLGDYRSHLSMKPSEYFARHIAMGASCMPRREAEMRHRIGLPSIMWGSDFPHPEGSWPYTRDQMIETFRGLPEDEVVAMLGGNAVRFYGLDAAALEPVAARIGPEKHWFRGELPPDRIRGLSP